MFYVYLLKQDDSIVYIGQTADVERRMIRHQRGRSTTLRKIFTDWVCWRTFETRQGAVSEEARLLKAYSQKYGMLPKYNKQPYQYQAVQHPVGYMALLDAIFRLKEAK